VPEGNAMTAEARSRSPNTPDGALGQGGWLLPLARWLGRSSRFAVEEAGLLVQVARDTIVDSLQPTESPRASVRTAPSATALVSELAELVAQTDNASLESDKRFWGLVRELYSRRPWVARKPRDLINTVGIEVKHATPSDKSKAKTTTADGSSVKPNAGSTGA
jgi:hypothetical protein